MATRVAMCIEHFYPLYNCPRCYEEREKAYHQKIAKYWEELKILPIDDPTPPQVYPNG